MAIYIYQNNQQVGPIVENAVWEMLKSGQLSPDTMAIRQGETQWQPLIQLYAAAHQQPVAVPNSPPVNQFQSNPPPKKSSKIWLFAVAGVAVLFLLGAVGIGALYLLMTSRSTAAVPLANKENVNADPTSKKSATVLSLNEENLKALLNKSEELAKLSPPLKAEDNPVIKGKVAIVEKSDGGDAKIIGFDYTGKEFSSMDLEEYAISPVRLAVRADEIETLIQILCRKGALVGRYEGGISGYANACKVSVIDYKKNAVVAQKSFTNNVPPKSISSIYERSGEYVFPDPEEVAEYVGGLPLEKLASPLVLTAPAKSDTYGQYKPFKDLAGELSRISFPVNLDSNAALKGKMAVVVKNPSGRAELKGIDGLGKDFYLYDYEKWGVGKEKLAANPDEIETLVQINCRKGSQIGSIKRTKVYSNQCQVSIVDYKAGKIISQKTFENKEMERDVDTELYPTQYVVINPFMEIDQFIKGLPKS